MRNGDLSMSKTQSGVTLIELITVVAIVGLLAGIAYPNYRQYVLRSKRADAKVALQSSAQSLETCFTRYHSYNDTANCPVALSLQDGGGLVSPDGNYVVTAEKGLPDIQFKLTATPQAGQAQDTDCLKFTLDQSNLRDATGPKGQAECWR
jgi:type IV pilus assembly protein PilE